MKFYVHFVCFFVIEYFTYLPFSILISRTEVVLTQSFHIDVVGGGVERVNKKDTRQGKRLYELFVNNFISYFLHLTIVLQDRYRKNTFILFWVYPFPRY